VVPLYTSVGVGSHRKCVQVVSTYALPSVPSVAATTAWLRASREALGIAAAWCQPTADDASDAPRAATATKGFIVNHP
jgi:hypothetical protein